MEILYRHPLMHWYFSHRSSEEKPLHLLLFRLPSAAAEAGPGPETNRVTPVLNGFASIV
jgi:hypothetical protein